ncbi:signal peptidase II [Roseixanthobacter liquoris]|uniref:signal peptidase II n=1 Tax=Roseixanthobacter liquoris TaxID=3119921 RepID=UPI00372D7B17
MWLGFAFVPALLVDVATKWLIVTVVMAPPRVIEITSFFNLTLGFNPGVSFGMFQDFFLERPMVLAAIKVAIATGLLVWAMSTEKAIEAIALGLIAGGAAGNIVDRVRQGGVTDFLDFHLGDWHWPAFNMADVAICAGVALLLMESLRPARPSLHVQASPNNAER